MIVFLLVGIALILALAFFPGAVGIVFALAVLGVLWMIWGWWAIAGFVALTLMILAAQAGDRAINARREAVE